MKTKRPSKNRSKTRKPRGKIYRASLPARIPLLHLDSSHLDDTNRDIPVGNLKITDFSADIQRRADLADTVIFVSDFGDARSLKHQISDENNAILRAGAEAFASAIAKKPFGGSSTPIKLGDVLSDETKAAIELEAETNDRMEKLVAESTDCATRSSFPVLPGESMEESIIRAGCDPEKVLANSRAQAEKWDESWAKLAATTEKIEVPAEEPGQSTLCSRAREAYETEQRVAQTARHKWVIETFGAGSWDGITHNESDDTYTICGYTWKVDCLIRYWLQCVDKVVDANGESWGLSPEAYTLADMGRAIEAIEKRIAEIKAIPKKPADMSTYPHGVAEPVSVRASFLSKLWDLLNTDLFTF